MDFTNIYKALRDSANTLSTMTGEEKATALLRVADALKNNHKKILDANARDIEAAKCEGVKDSLIDRLMLNDSRLTAIELSVKKIAELSDPIGQVTSGWSTPNGLNIRQIRVPLGVVAVIYESRPNVTVDTFALCFKSANAVLLRGSHSAYNTNRAIVDIIKESLSDLTTCKKGASDAISPTESSDVNVAKSNKSRTSYNDQLVNSLFLIDVSGGGHDDIKEILSAVGYIDVALPRGGKHLIDAVKSVAKIPIIETGSGVCHLYIDESADLAMATSIAENAKIQRPGVCNAIECILVHKNIIKEFLPALLEKFASRVTFHADDECYKIIESYNNSNNQKTKLLHATFDDEGHEYLDYECYIKCVTSIDDAITYINSHNTRHSESIITQNFFNAKKFQSQIDASCVYVNASTRFTDGGEFGFGAELGISTQKLHARGPMGLTALTTTKYFIDGNGQVR